MVFMRAFERFVRWNVSDNVKVGICVGVIMAFAVSPHVGKITKPGEGLFATERPQFIREAEQREAAAHMQARLGVDTSSTESSQ